MAEKTRYSDAELEEFRAIIMEKLELAQRDYTNNRLRTAFSHENTSVVAERLCDCLDCLDDLRIFSCRLLV